MAALALAASSACEIARPADLHPDVVALAIVLVVGEAEARLLAIHPHRVRGEAAPDITATLKGPGWTAPFADTIERDACTVAEGWPGPARCLRAALPEAIQPGAAYSLGGTAPLGSFAGWMRVPGSPLLLKPADGLRLAKPDSSQTRVEIPIRFHAGSDIGTVLADLLDVFEMQEDGTEEEIPAHYLGRFPHAVESAGADTLHLFLGRRPLRFSLRLVGIGWHHTNFLEHRGDRDLLLRPWPSFGIEGEGVYGYFDGATPSQAARILVR